VAVKNPSQISVDLAHGTALKQKNDGQDQFAERYFKRKQS
jgi:hypothetical protein